MCRESVTSSRHSLFFFYFVLHLSMLQRTQSSSTSLPFMMSRCCLRSHPHAPAPCAHTCRHTRRTPAAEMIASQCERPDGVFSTLDQHVEITVLGLDECWLKLLSPVGVSTQGNVKYPHPRLIYSPLCPSSSLTRGTSSRAGSPFLLS